MIIKCLGWEAGVKYEITGENDTECALLMASVTTDGVLGCGDEETQFYLTLPVGDE